MHNTFCSYCGSKIFDEDRTCLQCGAPTLNSIIKNNQISYSVPPSFKDKKILKHWGENLRMSGWTTSAAITLAQKIEAWNGGLKPTIFCNSVTMSYITPPDIYYKYADETANGNINFLMGYRISNNQNMLNKLCYITRSSEENCVYFASIKDNEIVPIVGVINV
jgi:hypothetical protein